MGKHVDALIVGSGIAALSVARTWLLRGKSVLVIGDRAAGASSVAAGVYNPVVLKRFNPVWKAQEQLDVLKPFYAGLEQDLNDLFDVQLDVRRLLHDEKEARTWAKKSQREDLTDFMDPEVHQLQMDGIVRKAGYGRVLQSGRVRVARLLDAYWKRLGHDNLFVHERLDYDTLKFTSAGVIYKDVSADRVIFCEGSGALTNSYFDWLPIIGNKGQLLHLRVPDLKLNFLLKSSLFLLPVGGDRYHAGATYEREYEDGDPCALSRKRLQEQLESFLAADYEVIDHVSGIRPTVPDRRPLVGQHPEQPRAFAFNGMGSRGVLIGPWAAQQLYASIYEDVPLLPDMDLQRYWPGS